MANHQIIEPRLKTPSTPSTGALAPSGSGTCRRPDTLVSDHVRRMAVASAVGAGLWTYGLVMDAIVRPLTVGVVHPASNVVIEAAAIVLSGLMFLYVRYAPHESHTKSDVGLWYFVLNAAAVGLLNVLARPLTHEAMNQLSWNTVVILVSAMIMPTTPRKMLAASIAAASMDPLSVWFAHLRGLSVPSIVDTFVLFMPNYACAAVAMVPSHRRSWA